MNIPLRIRILRALELSPMSIQQLARCLSASRAKVDLSLSLLYAEGSADRTRSPEHRNGRPANIWRVVL